MRSLLGRAHHQVAASSPPRWLTPERAPPRQAPKMLCGCPTAADTSPSRPQHRKYGLRPLDGRGSLLSRVMFPLALCGRAVAGGRRRPFTSADPETAYLPPSVRGQVACERRWPPFPPCPPYFAGPPRPGVVAPPTSHPILRPPQPCFYGRTADHRRRALETPPPAARGVPAVSVPAVGERSPA